MPDSSNISPAVLDWMRYSIRLDEAVLERPRHQTREHLALIMEEIALQRWIIDNVQSETMTGRAAIWREWMITWAGLQAARYANTISEAEFRRLATEALLRRDQRCNTQLQDMFGEK